MSLRANILATSGGTDGTDDSSVKGSNPVTDSMERK
jgi:hypothetical protein